MASERSSVANVKKWALLVLLLWGTVFPCEAWSAADTAAGTKIAAQLEKKYGILQDEKLTGRVINIGRELAAVSKYGSLEYTFKVLDSRAVNAFACPGGYIYICKGMLGLAHSDTELAGVLAHEVAHVTPAGTTDDEYAADFDGFRLLEDAGYNPYGLFVVLDKLGREYPKSKRRIARLSASLNAAGARMHVSEVQGKGILTFGDWRMEIDARLGTYKPLHRAWLLAGELFLLKNSNQTQEAVFVTRLEGEVAYLYHGDRLIYTVHQADVRKSGLGSLAELAGGYADKLNVWATMVVAKTADK